jgi:hypothetical protein
MSYILPRNLLVETGIRNIRELSKRYDKAKIYFHQDLDGVTTALAMKKYLEDNGIKVVDAEIIQYGDMEFAVKKASAKGDIMPVLVDFAHGKPMFVVHTDHHDTQVGVEKDTAKSFRSSRSNVETISQVISPSEIFPSDDIRMISTVDSADFVRMGVEPKDIMSYTFDLLQGNDENEMGFNITKNKKALALVTNKLLLAYKNKPNFLARLVLDSTPSLINIYTNIIKIAKEEGYATPESMNANRENYIKAQQANDKSKYYEEDKIIVQYGGGSMFKPGSYDRYVPFKNYPEADFMADFIITVWPLGLMQSSCNPFKKDRALKGVNLGEVKDEVLAKFEGELKEHKVSLNTIKYFGEKHKSFTEDSVGFMWSDLIALYNDTDGGIQGLDQVPKGAPEGYTVERWRDAIKTIMNKQYQDLTEREKKALYKIEISGWDIVKANSGGHKCITNISGLMYFGKDSVTKGGKEFLKRIGREFFKTLKGKIKADTSGE